MKHGLALITLLAVTSSATAQTQFYKCKDKWGQPVFSQRPCGDSAESGTIAEPQYSGSSAETAPAHAAPETVGSTTWDKIEASNASDKPIEKSSGVRVAFGAWRQSVSKRSPLCRTRKATPTIIWLAPPGEKASPPKCGR
ncbi:MAG: DUF4124 domain-containing protein [Haliea sp.]|nr:DUF4124 domain-containing protein [Haliea sp.]